MPAKTELFINQVKLIDIDRRSNIPTVLLYEENKIHIGHEALEKCASPHLLNEEFKIELGNEDPNQRRFETASGRLRSAAGLAKDFIERALELSKQWLDVRGLSMPTRALIAEPLAMGKAQQVDDAWLSRYRHALKRALYGRFEEIDFLPEPFAVYQYYRYGVRHALIAQKSKQVALVLDFGGGTFDVSVIESTKTGDISQTGRNSKPLSAASIPAGGFYLNRLIAKTLLEKNMPKGVSRSDIVKAMDKFVQYKNADASELNTLNEKYVIFIRHLKKALFSIEAAKIAICGSIASWALDADLSKGPGSRVAIPLNPFAINTEWAEVRLDAAMLREIFQKECWTQKLKPTIADAIRRASSELAGQGISVVLLSGGSSNIRWLKPLINQDLHSLLTDAEIIELSENFQEIVAKGLAIECARRFYTQGSGDFRAVTYNRLCMALRANEGELEVKRYRPITERLRTSDSDIGVLLPSASILSGMINTPLRWKVTLNRAPSRFLDYYFMKSSFDPDDIHSLHNIDHRVATPPRTRFSGSFEVELTVREDGTTLPRFIYGHGYQSRDCKCVEGKPFYLDMTLGLETSVGTTYLGFDFGTSNSSFSVVEENDIKVYSERRSDKRWLELNDLVSVLPYPVSVPLASYIAETGTLMEKCAREAFEAFLGLAAYVAYAEYCSVAGRARTKLLKNVQHRSAGPLWRLFREAVEQMGNRATFSARYSQLCREPFLKEVNDAVSNSSASKHGKIAPVDYPRVINLLANVTNQVFQSKVFGFFEDVQKKKFQRRGFTGVFRNAVGPGPVFMHFYEYEGEETFSSDEVFVIDLEERMALPLSPLIIWGLDKGFVRYDDKDFFMYDSWRETEQKFSFKAVRPREELILENDGDTALLFQELFDMRIEDQPRILMKKLELRARF